ncbi:hypothetical protein LCGC14_1040130 [marine sediment metagenome]|uniref:Uncharacterized protein n=1 Tax=marine sediment metagenome TaxID=412755 RepID=A0A0F9PYL8_9ZZZZ
MNVREALDTLAQVVEQYFRGLPAEQRIVQQAMQVIIKAALPGEMPVAPSMPEKDVKKKEASDGNKK